MDFRTFFVTFFVIWGVGLASYFLGRAHATHYAIKRLEEVQREIEQWKSQRS